MSEELMETFNKELFARAARFYGGYPTGQYDAEASFALENHYRLMAEVEELKLELKCFNAQRDKDIHLLHDAQAKLSVALGALKYHTAQTRPIHKTDEAIKLIEGK